MNTTTARHPLDDTVDLIDQAIAGSSSMILRARRSLTDARKTLNDDEARHFVNKALDHLRRADANAFTRGGSRMGRVPANLKAARVMVRLALQEEEGR